MPLVDIPTTATLQGFSPVLNVRQRIDSRALPNLIAFAAAFHRAFGRPLIVTEAARSRPRQLWLWNNRAALGIAVARPYTSRHDEITKATALDLGSGIATGSTPAAHWAHNNCRRFGIHWTGAGFNESWHFEVVPGTETVSLAGTTPAAVEVTPEPEPPKRRKKSMSTLYTNLDVKDTAPVWALAGDGVGAAGWLETTGQGLANDWAAVHGNAVGLSGRTFTNYRDRYLGNPSA